jgi:hypothetical protein
MGSRPDIVTRFLVGVIRALDAALHHFDHVRPHEARRVIEILRREVQVILDAADHDEARD